jgi:hypothetical protein
MPMRVRQTMGGYPVLDLAVREAQVTRRSTAVPMRRATPPSA